MDDVVAFLRRYATDHQLQDQASQMIRIALAGQWLGTDDAMWAALLQVAKERGGIK